MPEFKLIDLKRPGLKMRMKMKLWDTDTDKDFTCLYCSHKTDWISGFFQIKEFKSMMGAFFHCDSCGSWTNRIIQKFVRIW